MSFKPNLTATLLSLIGQHYYLTLSHGIKRSQIEPVVKAYIEKQMAMFANSQKGLRYQIFRPFRPVIEKLGRWLKNKYAAEIQNSKRTRK
jgi:hypothetical protein